MKIIQINLENEGLFLSDYKTIFRNPFRLFLCLAFHSYKIILEYFLYFLYCCTRISSLIYQLYTVYRQKPIRNKDVF